MTLTYSITTDNQPAIFVRVECDAPGGEPGEWDDYIHDTLGVWWPGARIELTVADDRHGVVRAYLREIGARGGRAGKGRPGRREICRKAGKAGAAARWGGGKK